MGGPQVLEDVCEFIVDCEHKTAPVEDDGYPSIRTPNIGRGRLLLEGVNRVSEETYRAWTRRAEPRENDLILAREAPVGNVAVVPPKLRVCLGQRTVLIRPNPTEVDPRYLLYLLLGDHVQAKFQSVSNGATVGHLNVKDIRELELPPLASREAQEKISAALSAYDRLVQNNERRMRILEEIVRTRFDALFLDAPAASPITLAEVCDEVRDGVEPEDITPGTPYIGLEHLPRRTVVASQWGDVADVTSRKFRFETGDVLFGKIRPNLHKVAVAPVSGVCSSDAIVLRPKAKMDLPIVLFGAASNRFVATAVKTAQGTKMPRANWAVMERFEFNRPSDLGIQGFRALASPIIESISSLVRRNRNLARTRDLLLPRLVSGAIDVSEIDIKTGGAES